MKTNKLITSTFVFLALSANTFANTKSIDSVKAIDSENSSLAILCNLGALKSSTFNTVTGRNNKNINKLRTSKNSSLMHTKFSKVTSLNVADRCELFNKENHISKGRN